MKKNHTIGIVLGLCMITVLVSAHSVFALETEKIKSETQGWFMTHIVPPIDNWRLRQVMIWELMLKTREQPEPVKTATDLVKKTITDKVIPTADPEMNSVIDSFNPETTISIAYTYLLQVLVWIFKTTVVFYALLIMVVLLVIKKLFSLFTSSSE